jgi:hypothetical protein
MNGFHLMEDATMSRCLVLIAVLLLGAPAFAAEPTFCDQCHAAGNCCNPYKTLCVSCGAAVDSPTATAAEELELELFGGHEAKAVPPGGFCDECHAAGNCCNPYKTLCVSCFSAEGVEAVGEIAFLAPPSCTPQNL